MKHHICPPHWKHVPVYNYFMHVSADNTSKQSSATFIKLLRNNLCTIIALGLCFRKIRKVANWTVCKRDANASKSFC